MSYYRYIDGENVSITEEEFSEFFTRHGLHDDEWIMNLNWQPVLQDIKED
jgi:hypothetical protein